MTFPDILSAIEIGANSPDSFDGVCKSLELRIFKLNVKQLSAILMEIGSIPESIAHDSTEEKLFAKTADIVLARCFQELGLHASVNKERADCADVIAKSHFHEYSLIGDAKAFRLSRTAKNQKDFKVTSMAGWKGDREYAVLVCPYFQYPKKNSQIYAQAIEKNVCLFSWEHLRLLLQSKVRETLLLNLSAIWSMSEQLAGKVLANQMNKKDNFHRLGNEIICKHLNLEPSSLKTQLIECKGAAVNRAEREIAFWTSHIEEVKKYTKEQAIAELLVALKTNEKISAIKEFIRKLPSDEKIW